MTHLQYVRELFKEMMVRLPENTPSLDVDIGGGIKLRMRHAFKDWHEWRLDIDAPFDISPKQLADQLMESWRANEVRELQGLDERVIGIWGATIQRKP